jgi:hypothetical protein
MVKPFLGEFDGFQMHLGYQWTGGVDHLQIAFALASRPHRGRNPMRAENHARAHGYFLQLFHENGPGFAQLVHYVTVMDDLLADINRRAIEVQRDLDYVDAPARLPRKNLRIITFGNLAADVAVRISF